MQVSRDKAVAYVDGWNFYHGINTPELHPLGFVNLRELCKRLLGAWELERVHYFSAADYQDEKKERQRFWLDALESAGVTIEKLGFFQHKPRTGTMEEKTTDVRIALKIAEDASTGDHACVLLVSADADFVPALEKAKELRKIIRVAFPPGLGCKRLEDVVPYRPDRICRDDLEAALFDGEACTKKGVYLKKALDYGWACKINGKVSYPPGGMRRR